MLEHEEQHIQDSVDGDHHGNGPILPSALLVGDAIRAEERLGEAVPTAATQHARPAGRAGVVGHGARLALLAVVLRARVHGDGRRDGLRAAPVADVVPDAARALGAVRTPLAAHAVVHCGHGLVHVHARRPQAVLLLVACAAEHLRQQRCSPYIVLRMRDMCKIINVQRKDKAFMV